MGADVPGRDPARPRGPHRASPLDGETTIAPERGLFLDRTWRLHPDLCAFTSRLFYRSQLKSRPGLERQVLGPGGPVDGAGLRYLPCPHEGHASEAPGEVKVVRTLVEDLVADAPRWYDREKGERTLALDDALVIAPYNAQVTALEEALPHSSPRQMRLANTFCRLREVGGQAIVRAGRHVQIHYFQDPDGHLWEVVYNPRLVVGG